MEREAICALMSLSRERRPIKMTHLGASSEALCYFSITGFGSVWELFWKMSVGEEVAHWFLFYFFPRYYSIYIYIFFTSNFEPGRELRVFSPFEVRRKEGFHQPLCGLTLNSRDQGSAFEDPALMALLAAPLLFI